MLAPADEAPSSQGRVLDTAPSRSFAAQVDQPVEVALPEVLRRGVTADFRSPSQRVTDPWPVDDMGALPGTARFGICCSTYADPALL